MATTAERDVALSWDAFLESSLEREGVHPSVRTGLLGQRRKAIELFREVEWPQIKYQLARDFQLQVPDGLEPHWTEAGRAIFWQEQVSTRADRDAKGIRVLREFREGWKPTNPVIANNASQLAQYLERGLRLRPPEQGVDVDVLRSAIPVGALQPQSPPVQVTTFDCLRHGDIRKFTTWKAYVQHCSNNREALEAEAPPEVMEMARKYRFYCYLHHKGFNSDRLAQRHIKLELRKPGRGSHLSLEQMVMVPAGAGTKGGK